MLIDIKVTEKQLSRLGELVELSDKWETPGGLS